MLRFLLVFMLFANVGYYSWTRGWLADMGMAPAITGEPRRLERQIRPQDLVLIAAPPPLPQTPAAAATLPPPYAAEAPPRTGATPGGETSLPPSAPETASP